MSEPRTNRKRSDPAPAGRVPLLSPASPAGAALRTAAAATAAMALAFALHLEVPALAVVFVLARGSAGAVTMLSGALAGSAAGIVLLQLFDQSRVAFSIALFVVTAVGTYGAVGKRYPYAWVQALLSLLILVGQALDTPDGAVRHAFFGVAAVLVAAIASFVAGASPPSAVPGLLQDALALRLRSLARAAARGADAPAVIALERATRRSRTLLANAWPTRLASRARFRALDAATAMVDRAHDGVLVVLARGRLAASAHPGSAAEGLAAALEIAAAQVAARRGAIDDTRGERATAARAVAARIRRTPLGVGDPLLFAVGRAARTVLVRLVLLSPSLLPGTRSAPRLAERTDRFARPTALDRYRLRHAVKSAAAYLLVLWAWVASEWGAIVPALVVSVLVATLATPVGATLRKALLRIAGVLVGGLAGLLVAIALLPFVTELPTICAVAAACLLAFLWIQQRHERLAFAALQAAIAFVLTLVHGTAPSPSWREPLESLIGLAFGIFVVVGIMHAAWPIDATTSAHTTLGELLDACGRRLRCLPDRNAPHDDGGAGRDARRTAARARELAVGFVHEVELYGTQFGRPAEDLARLARPVLELDALVGCLEALPGPAPDALREASARGLREFACAARRDCRRLAGGLRALPGERESCTADDLASPRCLPGIAPSGADDAMQAAACALIAALLLDLARALGDDGDLLRRDAA